MSIQIELESFLVKEGKSVPFLVALNSLDKIFKVAKFDKFSKDIKKLLKKECITNSSVQAINIYRNEFRKWDNINTTEDVVKVKAFLKQMYLQDNVDIEIKKMILLILSEFVDDEDFEFYLYLLENAFKNENIVNAIEIIEYSKYALDYIHKKNIIVNEHEHFWISHRKDGPEIMLNRVPFFKGKYQIEIFRNVKQLEKQQEFLSEFNYRLPVLMNHKNEEDSCMSYQLKSIESLTIRLDFKLNNDVIFKIDELPVIPFMKSIEELKKADTNRFELGKNKNFNVNIVDKALNRDIFSYEFCYQKSFEDYSLYISFVNKISKEIKFDVPNFLMMLEKVFIHLTLFLQAKHNICLRSEWKLSNKDFINLLIPLHYEWTQTNN